MRLTVGELAAIVDGEIVGEGDDVAMTSFTIDSRTASPGSCFFALRGVRDGHDFVLDAFARGVSAAVVDRQVEGAPGPLVRVPDPLVALGTLAAMKRDRLDATFVGITGSVGKTATKDLLAGAVAATRRVHASPESYNNESGVPLTLLAAPEDVEVVVVEMGARRLGDLSHLCEIVRPHVGAITSIGLAHVGPLGGIEGIVRAKGELLEHLPESGTAVLNAEIPAIDVLADRTRARVLTVGRSEADIVYREVRLDRELCATFDLVTPWGAGEVGLAVRGAHQAANATMAAAIALALDVPFDLVVEGLAKTRGAVHRMELARGPGTMWVLDDSYNANPSSVAAALRALAELPAERRIAVLGEMLELGEESHDAHRRVGELVSDLGIDVVVVVGQGARPIGEGAAPGARVVTVDDPSEATAFLLADRLSGDAVLVKASRAIGLESVAAELIEGAS